MRGRAEYGEPTETFLRGETVVSASEVNLVRAIGLSVLSVIAALTVTFSVLVSAAKVSDDSRPAVIPALAQLHSVGWWNVRRGSRARMR
jgi:hypothetical protein